MKIKHETVTFLQCCLLSIPVCLFYFYCGLHQYTCLFLSDLKEKMVKLLRECCGNSLFVFKYKSLCVPPVSIFSLQLGVMDQNQAAAQIGKISQHPLPAEASASSVDCSCCHSDISFKFSNGECLRCQLLACELLFSYSFCLITH